MLAEPGLNRLRGRIQTLSQNPIILKELRSRMRGSRAFLVLTLYLLFMVALIAVIYVPITYTVRSSGGPDQADVGKFVFGMILLVQMFLVAFIAPAFTAGAISGEKQNQSYDLLRTTLLTPRQLVTGKVLSALSYVFLLIFASMPLQSIAFLLGGITPVELIIAELLVLVTAAAFALIGLYFSTLLRTTIASTVATYAAALFLTIGIPAFMLVTVILQDMFRYGPISSYSGQGLVEILFNYLMMGLASWNLPATVIISETTLLDSGSYWGFTTSVYTGSISRTIWLPSPWYLYLIWYSVLTLFLYVACISRIRRIPDK